MKQHRKEPGLSTHVNASSAAPTSGPAPDRGALLWFGQSVSGNSGMGPDPEQIIGSAHGPRLLELLRAS